MVQIHMYVFFQKKRFTDPTDKYLKLEIGKKKQIQSKERFAIFSLNSSDFLGASGKAHNLSWS